MLVTGLFPPCTWYYSLLSCPEQHLGMSHDWCHSYLYIYIYSKTIFVSSFRKNKTIENSPVLLLFWVKTKRYNPKRKKPTKQKAKKIEPRGECPQKRNTETSIRGDSNERHGGQRTWSCGGSRELTSQRSQKTALFVSTIFMVPKKSSFLNYFEHLRS